MQRLVVCAAAVTALIAGSGVQAQPLVATYTGVLLDTNDAFTAAFYYDTADLVPSPGNSDFLDAKPGTVQSASYSDPFRSVFLTNPLSFSKGEYDSTVYDADGNITEIDTIHDYTIRVSSGFLSLRFGGVGDSGAIAFSSDGLDYAQLDPRSFLLTKAVVSPVPLPSGAPMLGGALALLGIFGAMRGVRARFAA